MTTSPVAQEEDWWESFLEEEWWKAVQSGDDGQVAELLAISPELVAATRLEMTALDCACESGHEALVARLLAAGSPIGLTTLQRAVAGCHSRVVLSQLVSAKPDLIVRMIDLGMFILACDQREGRKLEDFEPVLKACLALSDFAAKTTHHEHLLITVARLGHDNMVAKILNLRPDLPPTVVDGNGWGLLRVALFWQRQCVVEMLLDFDSNLISSLSFDELASAFTTKTPNFSVSYDGRRYDPVIKRQCEPLVERLNPNVASVVFEYLECDGLFFSL